MKTTKIFSLGILSVFLLGILLAVNYVAAAGPQGPTDINGNHYQGSLAPGEAHQFRFRNMFMLQFQSNGTVNMTVDCDVDAVGERTFQLALNNSNDGETTQLQAQIQAENTAVNLTDGQQIQARNQHRYRYTNRFMVNLTCNNTEGLQAKLQVDCENQEETWAYLDEVEDEWVPVDSEVVDGLLTAETDHFSLWTVLTPEAEETTTEGTIDGYSIFGILMSMGIVGAVLYKRRH